MCVNFLQTGDWTQGTAGLTSVMNPYLKGIPFVVVLPIELQLKKMAFKGNGYSYMQSIFSFPYPLSTEVNSLKNEFALIEAILPIKSRPISGRLSLSKEASMKSQKCFPLLKLAEI